MHIFLAPAGTSWQGPSLFPPPPSTSPRPSPSSPPPPYFDFIYLEKRREGEREGEKHQCEREMSITCLLSMPLRGSKHTTQARALPRNQTGDLLLCRTAR